MEKLIKVKKNYYYSLKFVVLFLIVPIFSNAQIENIGTITNLSVNSCFGKIYLGENINLIPKNKLLFMDGDSSRDIDGCLKYEYHDIDQVNTDNNLDLDMIGLRVYNGKVIDLYVFFKKENGHQLFQLFESKYGKYTQRTDDFTYNWENNDVKLYLKSGSENFGVAIFYYKKLYQQMAENNTTRLAAQ